MHEDHRKIIDLDWINRQGWQVITCLIGSESDSTKNQGCTINQSHPPLIKAGHNPLEAFHGNGVSSSLGAWLRNAAMRSSELLIFI